MSTPFPSLRFKLVSTLTPCFLRCIALGEERSTDTTEYKSKSVFRVFRNSTVSEFELFLKNDAEASSRQLTTMTVCRCVFKHSHWKISSFRFSEPVLGARPPTAEKRLRCENGQQFSRNKCLLFETVARQTVDETRTRSLPFYLLPSTAVSCRVDPCLGIPTPLRQR